MGYLVDNNVIKGSVFEYFKSNSLYFYDKFNSSDKLVWIWMETRSPIFRS